MQIAIRIPKEKEETLIKHMKLDRNFRECEIVELPKGHGRLIDADKIRFVRSPDSMIESNVEIALQAVREYIPNFLLKYFK